jgi:maleylacetate reductase
MFSPEGFVHDAAAVRVIFAPGAVARVGPEVERLGAARVLLVAGGSAARHADRIAGDLGVRLVGRIRDAVRHVPVAVAEAAVATARTAAADAVVSVGGGSATGLAKAVALETGLPIVAVPTTYAGSEMTPIWGRTDHAGKVTGRDPRVLPRVVVYDPELTLPLPAAVSAASGMNALAHCVEGLYAAGASPVTALLAEEGIRALSRALPVVVADGTDLGARGTALYGAWLAGWTLGTAGMGVHHAICHVLGGSYDLPHAEVHAVILPYAAAFNATHAAPALVRAAAALGVADAAGGLWDLGRRLGAPASLAELGLPYERMDRAVERVVAARPANPRPVDAAGVRTLLRAAWAGERPAGSRT